MKPMSVLNISLDKAILTRSYADAFDRQLDYAKHFKQLTLIVLSTKEDKLKTIKKGNLKIIPTNSINKWFSLTDAVKIGIKEHRFNNYNVITAQDPIATGLIGIALKHLLHLPLNIQLHSEFSLSTEWINLAPTNRLIVPLVDWIIQQADTLRIDNKAKEARLKKRFPNLKAKIFQAPMRVDLDFFWHQAKPKKNIRRLISVGRLAKEKNFPLLIQAMKQVVTTHPEVKLTLVGGGEEETHLRELIQTNRLGQHVDLVGNLPREKVRDMLHQSDAFILSSNYEGWGLVFVEAFAAGLPVVTTRVGSTGELVKSGENGLVVPVGNATKLAQAIIKLIENPKLANQFAKNGQNQIKKEYAPQVITQKWITGLIDTVSKPKVLVIFPEASSSSTHYPYWYELFDEASKNLNTHILYESIQKIKLKPFNLLERFLNIFYWRLKGYNHVYIHYSYWGVVLSKIVSLFLPMKIYYWNCEKYDQKPNDWLLNLSLKLTDVLVTGSQSIGEQYQKIFNLNQKPIKIVPNWVKPVEANAINLPKNKIHILFVHHLSPRKGSRELPTIITETLKSVPKAHFHIVGSGPDAHLLTQLPHTTLYGNLPLTKTAAFYQSCDYFIMPSRAEGFPRVILEAMINQIPFVATRVGNVTEIVAKAQLPYITSPENPKQFAKILVNLIKSKNKKRLIAANYQKVITEYNKAKAVEAFITL